MENSVKERLVSFLNYRKLSQSKFEKLIGAGNGYVNNISKGIGGEKLQRILSYFPELNSGWLMTGVGSMLNNAENTPLPNHIPLIPTYARAGKFDDFTTQVSKYDYEKVISPLKHAEFAITVYGDSMAPEFVSGSQVHIMKVNEKAFLEWGKVYVLDTCNGTVLKKIFKTDKENVIRCSSINKEYEDFEVNT